MGNHRPNSWLPREIMFRYILCVFCCLTGLYAYANDTSGTVLPTGGVVFEKQDGIKMKTEALYIRPGQIEVNYLFENTTIICLKTPRTKILLPKFSSPCPKCQP